jgi:rSAM/selenodomain-associated transferase 1
MSAREEVLLVFARAPEPGRSKTRLAAAIGAREAAELHAAFVLDVLERHAAPGRRLILCTTGDPLHPFWRTVPAHLEQRDQGDGDLGARLDRACAPLLEAGAHMVVIGTDSPALATSRVDAAFAALATVDAVLGPADDGGYYLLGLSRPCPAVFQDIPWGTDRVSADTRARLAASNCRWTELPADYDVDHVEDLHRLLADIEGLRAQGERWPTRTDRLLSKWRSDGRLERWSPRPDPR